MLYISRINYIILIPNVKIRLTTNKILYWVKFTDSEKKSVNKVPLVFLVYNSKLIGIDILWKVDYL